MNVIALLCPCGRENNPPFDEWQESSLPLVASWLQYDGTSLRNLSTILVPKMARGDAFRKLVTRRFPEPKQTGFWGRWGRVMTLALIWE